ncbi:hypothetical protein Taro_033644 [Colocasia esculenta]|uniref:FMR1-interacting protein 1 conserved domain-containing protein n=1 Tax=Colocasia esculenta TaxID=4460 RepID=A0A843W9L1_COLES|nr:hypothetical protein [Colocasia esculenta]
MFPFLPYLPNNLEGCSGIAPQQMMLPSLQQEVCNPSSQPNPGGFGNMQQLQPQWHAHHQFQNPQMAALNNQSMDNVHGSSMVMPNRPQMTTPPSLACAPNIPLALQTSLIGMQPQQGHPCFQNPQNLNPIVGLPFHGQIYNVPQTFNQLGLPQLSGQFGISGQMQSLNQIGPFPRGEQFWPQNLSQNLNQVTGLPAQAIQTLNQIQQFSQQAASIAQPGLFNASQASLLMAAGHGSKNAFFPNSSGFGNALVSADPSKGKGQGQGTFIGQAIISQNAGQNSIATMQTPPPLFAAGSTKLNEKQNNFASGSVQLGQVGHTGNGKHDISASTFGQFAYRNFNKNNRGIVKREQSDRRQALIFQKPNQHVANEGSFAKKWGKGPQNGRERKPRVEKYENRRPEKCQRRALTLKYTEEEISQWCEARKRNFPTAANIERKKHQSDENSEVLNANAQICRQQLKDVLAKQMELGLEAAEIPSHYLSDPESIPRHDKKETHMGVRFPDKYGKRGRHGREKWQSRRQKSRDEASPVTVPTKREPTLLQRLLSSEIKRDRSQLLQALRFMTLNSFFEHWPDKALVYSQVTVKDDGCQVVYAKGTSSHGQGSTISGASKKSGAEEVHDQAEASAGEGGESANESICTRDGDGLEEGEDSLIS